VIPFNKGLEAGVGEDPVHLSLKEINPAELLHVAQEFWLFT
jgi:hypothetical protein